MFGVQGSLPEWRGHLWRFSGPRGDSRKPKGVAPVPSSASPPGISPLVTGVCLWLPGPPGLALLQWGDLASSG